MVRVESGLQLINHNLCRFKQSLFRVSVFAYPLSDMGAHMEDKCCFHKKEKRGGCCCLTARPQASISLLWPALLTSSGPMFCSGPFKRCPRPLCTGTLSIFYVSSGKCPTFGTEAVCCANALLQASSLPVRPAQVPPCLVTGGS